MHDDTSPVRQIIAAMVAGVVLLLLWFAAVGSCHADYVAACTATWCKPCQAMRPIEDKLRNERFDIRHIDVDKYQDWKRACRVVPTFFYVYECPVDGKAYLIARIEGACSEQRLRQFCYTPIAADIITATGNAFQQLGRWIGGRP